MSPLMSRRCSAGRLTMWRGAQETRAKSLRLVRDVLKWIPRVRHGSPLRILGPPEL